MSTQHLGLNRSSSSSTEDSTNSVLISSPLAARLSVRHFIPTKVVPTQLINLRFIGARPSKGQELEEHYFGRMPRRVMACLEEVDLELWELGVPSMTRHNEVAPSQYEMAPIFEKSTIACDHNMLTMVHTRKDSNWQNKEFNSLMAGNTQRRRQKAWPRVPSP